MDSFKKQEIQKIKSDQIFIKFTKDKQIKKLVEDKKNCVFNFDDDTVQVEDMRPKMRV